LKPLTITINPLPRIVRIDLRGDLSALPSVTNRRIICRGRLIKEPKAQQAIHDLTWLFKQESNLIAPLVRFGAEPVHVIAILGERYDRLGRRRSRWDSHNMAKVIGDWLQMIEVIDDDQRAEIMCVKRIDYFGDDQLLTSIIIQPKKRVANCLGAFVHHVNEQSLTVAMTDKDLPVDLMAPQGKLSN